MPANLLDVFGRGLRHALRALRGTPVFVVTSVATLALTIGACAAVFSLADALLLQPPPYPEPDRLAFVQAEYRSARGTGAQLAHDAATWEAVRDNVPALDSAVYFGGVTGVNLVVGDRASFVNQERVSAGYFRVLGVLPAIGREFAASEDVPGGPALAVISHDIWVRELAGAPDILGRSIQLRGEAYLVIGVMPTSFGVTDDVDVWTPLRPSRQGEGGGTNFQIVSRLKPAATWDQARAELRSLGAGPLEARGMREENGVSGWLSVRPMQEVLADESRGSILMLGAAVTAVLLIACVNIAALLLARGASRSREVATRLALGASRFAVVRQMMVESVLLALSGGTLGILVAHASLAGLERLAPPGFAQWGQAAVDGRTLAVMAGLALLASVLFGLVPALHASRLDVRSALVEGGSRAVAGGGRHWLGRGLVVSEVALGVALLVVAGLLVRTVANVNNVDPGFDPDNLVTASVSLQDARYQTAEAVNRLFDESLRVLGETAGVESAAVSLQLPYTRLLNMGFRLPDEPDNGGATVNVSYVSPGFVETYRIPVRQGRTITARDRADSPPVLLVNETFARIYGSQDRSILGRSILLSGAGVQREIVGVVGDVQQTDSGFGFEGRVEGPVMTTPTVFVPAAQVPAALFNGVHTWFRPAWTVRTRAEGQAASAIAAAVARTDPLLPVSPESNIRAVMAAATSTERLMMTLVGTLAAAAMLLAALGIYGLVAHSVAQRRRELGIRLALGATPAQATGRAVLPGIGLAVTGTAAGGILSIWSVGLVRGFLWGVDGYDPATYLAVAALFIFVATAASLLPARRILKLDPAETLRD
jgi:predicted permease